MPVTQIRTNKTATITGTVAISSVAHKAGINDISVTELAITTELPCASVSKPVCMQNISYENEFNLHELTDETHS